MLKTLTWQALFSFLNAKPAALQTAVFPQQEFFNFVAAEESTFSGGGDDSQTGWTVTIVGHSIKYTIYSYIHMHQQSAIAAAAATFS